MSERSSSWTVASAAVFGIGLATWITLAPNFGNDIAEPGEVAPSSSFVERVTPDIADYTNMATAIVAGRFSSMGDIELGDDGTFHYRNLYFLVDAVIKGNVEPGTIMNILTYDGEGGILEDYVRYRENQQNVLFLGMNEDDEYVVFAGDWGQFIVRNGMVRDFQNRTVSLEKFLYDIRRCIP